MLRRCWISIGLVVFAAIGCDDDTPPPTLAERAAEVRELDFLEEVVVEKVSREEYRASREAESQELTDEELGDLAETYGRLGFFAPSLDLRTTYAASWDWIGAFYSSDDRKITIVGEAEDALLVHEYVHALQDQHFDLAAFKDVETSDELLARRAIIEGDASLAADRFYAEEEGFELERVDWKKYIDQLRHRADAVLDEAEVPPFFSAYPSFAYGVGEIYCAYNLLGVTDQQPRPKAGPYDWSDEDELFGVRAPGSTLAVMTLDRTQPDPPVGLDDVPAELATRYVRFDTDVLGAWYMRLLLIPVEEPAKISAAAFAQDARGDRVLFVNDVTSGRRAVVFTSAWVDEARAEQLAGYMGMLHGITKDPLEPRLGIAADGEAVWVERSGRKVVVIKNLATEDMEAMATAALSNGFSASRKVVPPQRSRLLRTLRRFPAFR